MAALEKILPATSRYATCSALDDAVCPPPWYWGVKTSGLRVATAAPGADAELASVGPVAEPEHTDARECLVDGRCVPRVTRRSLGEDIDGVAKATELTSQLVHVLFDASDLRRIPRRHQGKLHAVPDTGLAMRSNPAPIACAASALGFRRPGIARTPSMNASKSSA